MLFSLETMGIDAQGLIGETSGSRGFVPREDTDRTEEVVWNGGAGKLASWIYLNLKEKRTRMVNFLALQEDYCAVYAGVHYYGE